MKKENALLIVCWEEKKEKKKRKSTVNAVRANSEKYKNSLTWNDTPKIWKNFNVWNTNHGKRQYWTIPFEYIKNLFKKMALNSQIVNFNQY